MGVVETIAVSCLRVLLWQVFCGCRAIEHCRYFRWALAWYVLVIH